eukprot:gene15977-biopygen12773
MDFRMLFFVTPRRPDRDPTARRRMISCAARYHSNFGHPGACALYREGETVEDASGTRPRPLLPGSARWRRVWAPKQQMSVRAPPF